jgi:hypothetical protein
MNINEVLATETNPYRRFVEDMASFIRFAVENDRDEIIMTTLIHDILGVDREGLNDLFLPRVSGYSERS